MGEATDIVALLRARAAEEHEMLGDIHIPLEQAANEIERLRTTLAQPQLRDAPEGFVLVPKEPTEEMLLAAYEQACASLLDGIGNTHCKSDEERSAHAIRPLYHAMLATAPPSPALAIRQPEESQ